MVKKGWGEYEKKAKEARRELILEIRLIVAKRKSGRKKRGMEKEDSKARQRNRCKITGTGNKICLLVLRRQVSFQKEFE